MYSYSNFTPLKIRESLVYIKKKIDMPRNIKNIYDIFKCGLLGSKPVCKISSSCEYTMSIRVLICFICKNRNKANTCTYNFYNISLII